MIEEEIKRYAGGKRKRWHTPGHKGALCSNDITEIEACFPLDFIDTAQKDAALFYGSKYCRFLVGGSSMGIKASIMSAGGDILIAGGCHRAVYEGGRLARVNLVEMGCGDKITPPSAEELLKALKDNPFVKAVLLTSPTYFGRTLSGEAVDAVKRSGKIFLADSAHGAHFASDEKLFPPCLSRVCDAVNLSAHKTLHAYTQSAYLCVNNESLMEEIDDRLSLLGTTSPSYLFLSQLEKAVAYEKENGRKYSALVGAAKKFRDSVACLNNDDPLRLVVDAYAYGLSGKELFEKLYENGQCAETYDENYVIFIITLFDTPEEIAGLENAIKEVI